MIELAPALTFPLIISRQSPVSAFMKGEIDMGTLALWTKAWLLFCRNKLFMFQWGSWGV